jgi:hypothetical protein
MGNYEFEIEVQVCGNDVRFLVLHQLLVMKRFGHQLKSEV